ncbi:sensor histidine kinase [Psychroserpens sp. Hel_I_66]|uniref:tetratricopeptide repeat-containing sensor histidine kinase n=1 Tax=Psychroserpens sp. Hel_I_66 TaxID=1250004 RepID=UPI000647D240|nr:sensor histidine kinase [Psychroserpens sp. Hel_I_66]
MKCFWISFVFIFFQVSFAQNDSLFIDGQQLIYENKFDEAIDFYKNRLAETENREQTFESYMGLAEVYKLNLDYNQANDFYLKAFEIVKETDNPQLKFLYHVKMAEFYRKRTLFKEASTELDKASLILKYNTISDASLVKFYSRKAALFTEYFHKQDSTLLYAERALKLAKKINDKDNIFYSTLEISGVYEDQKEYGKAISYLQELIVYALENKLIQQRADAYVNYTRLLIKDNQLNKALTESLKALDFAKKNELLYNEILFTDNTRNIYEKLGNTNKAYEYLKIRLQLTDQYYQLEHNKFLFELEEKYKLEDKENQIKINTLEIDNQNKALATNKTKLYVSIVFLVFAIAIAILIAHFLKKEKNSNKQLQDLSQENEFLLSEANHRINNNLQLVVILISDQLKKTKGQEGFQLKNILTKVEAISTLHKHLYKNEDKKKVDIHDYLNDVKATFFEVFKENDIQNKFHIASAETPTDYAMYLGLLLTELYINSIKHAFGSQDHKEIDFELKYDENNFLYFNYSDNGTQAKGKKIQPKLIDKICRQLKIEYDIDTTNGFNFSFEKKLNND